MCRGIQDHDDPRYCCDCHLDEDEERDDWFDQRHAEYIDDMMREKEAARAAEEEETNPLEAGP